mgnify:CR=1 FL=1
MKKTSENLATAFAGESQAYQKYTAFAKQADAEGFALAAKMFRAAAQAEANHAYLHLKNMDGIGSTAQNLKKAIEGETYEFENMYPPFIKEAQQEGHTSAVRGLNFANEAEKIHAARYSQVLAGLDSKEVYDVYLCPICGHIEFKNAPDQCPICGAKAALYQKID